MVTQDQEKEYGVYFDVGRMHLIEQHNRKNAIDTKASWILGFSATALGIMGIFLPDAADWAKWIAVSAVIAFACSAFCAVAVLRIRNFNTGVTPAQMKQYLEWSEVQLRLWTADSMNVAVAETNGILRQRAQFLTAALFAFAVEGALVGIIAISIAFADADVSTALLEQVAPVAGG